MSSANNGQGTSKRWFWVTAFLVFVSGGGVYKFLARREREEIWKRNTERLHDLMRDKSEL